MIRHSELWAVFRLTLWWEVFLASWFFALHTMHFYFSLRADSRPGTVFRSFIYSFPLGFKDMFLSEPFPRKVSLNSPVSNESHYRGLLTTEWQNDERNFGKMRWKMSYSHNILESIYYYNLRFKSDRSSDFQCYRLYKKTWKWGAEWYSGLTINQENEKKKYVGSY